MKLDLELLRASVSGMMMYCKDADMKKALKKHANTIDLMIEGQTLPIDSVVGRSEQLECDVCYQPTNNIKDDEGKRYCDSCEEL